MRAEVVRVLEFAGEIDGIASRGSLLDGLKSRLEPFGVTSLSVNLIHQPGQPPNPHALLGERWEHWSRHYVRTRLGDHDPAVRMLKAHARPFAWSEALAQYRSSSAERVMDACLEFTGSRDGFVVPVRDADGAVLTAAFSGFEVDLSPDARSALHLAGYYFALRGREIVQGIGLQPDCPLSPRQIDCLRWVQAGKTDAEIAILLQVSPRTVHNHIEKAKAMLNTPKRSVAAFEAWRRGWLE